MNGILIKEYSASDAQKTRVIGDGIESAIARRPTGKNILLEYIFKKNIKTKIDWSAACIDKNKDFIYLVGGTTDAEGEFSKKDMYIVLIKMIGMIYHQ